MDDVLSLQPGQKERRGIGLLSSEDRDNSSCVELENAEQITVSRFGNIQTVLSPVVLKRTSH